MIEFKVWLQQKCCKDPDIIPLSEYNLPYANNKIRIFYDNKVYDGKILENISYDLYLVTIGKKIYEIYLKDYDCYIQKQILTNYQFCHKHAIKIIDYIDNCELISLRYNRQKFINDFCYFVYLNSKY